MIDFRGYTNFAIQKEMLAQVPSTIDTREGSIIQTAIGPVAWYLEGLYMLLSQIQENSYVGTAVGDYLDYIAAGRGITRKMATAAVRYGTFNAEIPSGSKFKTINGVNSVIFESGDLYSKSEDEYVYLMTCTTAGTIGNSYTGRLLPVTSISGLTTAMIGEIRIAGTEEETDDALRERYLQTFGTEAFGGNIAAYRQAILAIDGVGAVQIYPAWKGGGTVLCSILSSNLAPASSDLIETVQNKICPPEDGETGPSANGYGMAPIGAAVTITTAEELVLNISCTVQFESDVSNGVVTYQAQIEEGIQAYLTTACETWGDALRSNKVEYSVSVYVARIVAAILNIPAVVNVTDVTINGSSSDLTLTETKDLQQIPVLGTVMINGE